MGLAAPGRNMLFLGIFGDNVEAGSATLAIWPFTCWRPGGSAGQILAGYQHLRASAPARHRRRLGAYIVMFPRSRCGCCDPGPIFTVTRVRRWSFSACGSCSTPERIAA